jgi:hypothetical protein
LSGPPLPQDARSGPGRATKYKYSNLGVALFECRFHETAGPTDAVTLRQNGGEWSRLVRMLHKQRFYHALLPGPAIAVHKSYAGCTFCEAARSQLTVRCGKWRHLN